MRLDFGILSEAACLLCLVLLRAPPASPRGVRMHLFLLCDIIYLFLLWKMNKAFFVSRIRGAVVPWAPKVCLIVFK